MALETALTLLQHRSFNNGTQESVCEYEFDAESLINRSQTALTAVCA